MRMREIMETRPVSRAALEREHHRLSREMWAYEDGSKNRQYSDEERAGFAAKAKELRAELEHVEAELIARTPKPKDKQGREINYDAKGHRVLPIDLDAVEIKQMTQPPMQAPNVKGGKFYRIMMSGVKIGYILIERTTSNSGKPIAYMHTHIDSEEHRRRGVGTKVYDMVEAMLAQQGITLHPSPELTDASRSFWSKRDPRKLANHRAEERKNGVVAVSDRGNVVESVNQGSIETAVRAIRDRNAPNFRGNCEGAAGDLTVDLHRMGVPCKMIYGAYDEPMNFGPEKWPVTPHCWVETDDLILDPTVEQFGHDRMIVRKNSADGRKYHGGWDEKTPEELLTYEEYLTESRIDEAETHDGVVFLKNPGVKAIRYALNKASFKELRGIIDPNTNDVWMWDAGRLLHDEAVRVLGIEYKKPLNYWHYTFDIAVVKGVTYVRRSTETPHNLVQDMPYFQRISDVASTTPQTPIRLNEGVLDWATKKLILSRVKKHRLYGDLRASIAHATYYEDALYGTRAQVYANVQDGVNDDGSDEAVLDDLLKRYHRWENDYNRIIRVILHDIGMGSECRYDLYRAVKMDITPVPEPGDPGPKLKPTTGPWG